MDNRGAGRSGKPAGPYSIRQLADDAHAVLTQGNAVPAHIVGTSMGGYIALTLALRHPEAVRSLTLIATTSGGPGAHGVPEETLQAWTKRGPSRRGGLRPGDHAPVLRPGLGRRTPRRIRKAVGAAVDGAHPRRSVARPVRCVRNLSHRWRTGGQVTAPTTIVHGTHDRVVPYANAEHLPAANPARTGDHPEGAGHLCWIEQPEVVNGIIVSAITASDHRAGVVMKHRRPNPRAVR